jgi:mono/diheme cytochrome c family protein
MSVRTAKWCLAAAGVAVALAAMSQPSAAQDGTKPAGDDAAKMAKGKDLFANYGCGGCHSLADAGATGHVGPSFDGDSNLTESFVVNRVTNGQGAMPAFGDQMSADEIAAVAAYVTHAASK